MGSVTCLRAYDSPNVIFHDNSVFTYQVKPAQIVDKLVEIAVDILVPGRGAGEGNW